uniref:Lysosome-associated membrane glycoprotein 2-like luminal domain-containing protein n=1 Tax=Cacopsylla melanoneura TaxID=428564 RepID=A0A8D9ARN2_9HEMI
MSSIKFLLLFLNCLFQYSTALPASSKTSADTESSLNVPTENVLLKTTKRLNADSLKSVVDQSTEGMKSPPSTRKSQKKEPRIRATPTTTTIATTQVPNGVAVYRYKNEDGKTCILMQVDAVVEFKYKDKLGEKRATDTYVPNPGGGANRAAVDGNCDEEEDLEQSLKIMWRSYVLVISFKKTPGGERWYIFNVLLECSSNEKEFEHFRFPGRTLRFSTPADNSFVLFPTPVGQAFTCHRDLSVELEDPDTPETTATLLLREFKTEPFMFKSESYGQDHVCSDPRTGGGRSEAAPFIVGSMLAFAALCMVTGYSIYRYFKIKKVQYDTME